MSVMLAPDHIPHCRGPPKGTGEEHATALPLPPTCSTFCCVMQAHLGKTVLLLAVSLMVPAVVQGRTPGAIGLAYRKRVSGANFTSARSNCVELCPPVKGNLTPVEKVEAIKDEILAKLCSPAKVLASCPHCSLVLSSPMPLAVPYVPGTPCKSPGKLVRMTGEAQAVASSGPH